MAAQASYWELGLSKMRRVHLEKDRYLCLGIVNKWLPGNHSYVKVRDSSHSQVIDLWDISRLEKTQVTHC